MLAARSVAFQNTLHGVRSGLQMAEGKGVVVVSFGEGAMNQDALHEGFVFAAARNLPWSSSSSIIDLPRSASRLHGSRPIEPPSEPGRAWRDCFAGTIRPSRPVASRSAEGHNVDISADITQRVFWNLTR